MMIKYLLDNQKSEITLHNHFAKQIHVYVVRYSLYPLSTLDINITVLFIILILDFTQTIGPVQPSLKFIVGARAS